MMHKIRRTMVQGALQKMERLPGMMFQGERNAHCFVIAPMEGVSFAGYGVAGRCVREDRADVNISGYLDDAGNAVVPVTPACCDLPGMAKFFVYVVKDEETVCVYACWADIQNTQGGGTAEDGEPIIEYYPDERMDAVEARMDQFDTDLRATLFKTATQGSTKNHVDFSDAMDGPVEVGLNLPAGRYNENLFQGPYTRSGESTAAFGAQGTPGKRYMLSFLLHEEAEDNPPCTVSFVYYDADGNPTQTDGLVMYAVSTPPATFPRDSRRFVTANLPADAPGGFYFRLYSIKGTCSLSEILIEETNDTYPGPFHEASAGRPLYAYTGTTLTLSHLSSPVTREISYPGTVYGGSLKLLRSGVAELTVFPAYASYNGEELVGPWLSSLDEYQEGATPTLGAQVVDLGGTPKVHRIPCEALAAHSGYTNTLSCPADDGNSLTATYPVDMETLKPESAYTAADTTSGVVIWSYGGVAGACVATQKSITFTSTSWTTIKTGLNKPRSTTIYFPVLLSRVTGSVVNAVVGLGRVNGTTLSVAAPAQGSYYLNFDISYPISE